MSHTRFTDVCANDTVHMLDDDHSQYALQSYADCRDKVMSVTLYLYVRCSRGWFATQQPRKSSFCTARSFRSACCIAPLPRWAVPWGRPPSRCGYQAAAGPRSNCNRRSRWDVADGLGGPKGGICTWARTSDRRKAQSQSLVERSRAQKESRHRRYGTSRREASSLIIRSAAGGACCRACLKAELSFFYKCSVGADGARLYPS